MNPHGNSSTEPEHLVGVSKTCPRLDCPNPTIGISWRGSAKQLQYHCYGCWRKFNYGGVLRSWAKQVSPPTGWLRRHAPDVKEAPKLLELQPPCRSGPNLKRTHRSPSRRSVAKSSAKEDDTTNAVHAAEPSQKRTRRANVNHEMNKKDKTAVATSSEGHGIGFARCWTLSVIDADVTEFNGFGDEEAHHSPGTQTTRTSDNMNGLMNDIDDLAVDGVHAPVWQSCRSPSPVANVLREDEVNGAGNTSVAATDNNPIVQGTTSGSINAASGDVTAEPRRRALNDIDDLHGEDGVDTPVWHSFKSPKAHILWDDEVNGVGIASVAATDNNPILEGTTSGSINAASGDVTVAATDNNPILEGTTSGLINASASGDNTAEPPCRRRAMTITFRRYSVPSKTFDYGLQG